MIIITILKRRGASLSWPPASCSPHKAAGIKKTEQQATTGVKTVHSNSTYTVRDKRNETELQTSSMATR